MKRIQQIIVAALLLLTLNHSLFTAFAQGTAFTYQGQLQNNSSLASGTYNLTFSLYTNASGGTLVTGPVTNNGVVVTNGLFTVKIDFGSSPWNGQTNWLQIGVETNNATFFSPLTPRQEVTPVPYGIYAENATMLVSGTAIGAGAGNSISASSAVDSFIGGGQDNTILAGDIYAVIGGGQYNTNSGGYATVGGGVLNSARGGAATVGGGQGNTASASYATVGGGINNTASAAGTFIGGGGYDGTFGGNLDQALGAAIGGGVGNSIQSGGNDGFIGGGLDNTIQANSSYSIIAAGSGNQIRANSTYSTIAGGGSNAIYTNNSASAIAGGSDNTIQANDDNAFIGGGYLNIIASNLVHSTIGGGVQNKIQPMSSYATIAGGNGNLVQSNSAYSTIAGGGGNSIYADNSASAIAGGSGNTIYTGNDNSFIGGGYLNYIEEADSFSTIGGGEGNEVYLGGGASYSTIAGGNGNFILDSYTFVGGGYGNYIYPGGTYAAIPGGSNNVANGISSVVPGGANNSAGGNYSLAAGQQAQALYQGDFVWADSQNASFASTANDQFLIRAQGGVGIGTTTPHGALDVSSAGPIQLELESTGSQPATMRFNCGGPEPVDVVGCDGEVTWAINYPVGTFLMTLSATPSPYLQVDGQLICNQLTCFGNALFSSNTTNVGNVLVDGNVTVNSSITSCGYNLCSDRHAKENFIAIDPQQVLDKVASLPVTEWNYKTDKTMQHIGPMAQDFHAAFGLNGADDKHISVVDEGGVALAAIQGLNQKLDEKDAEIRQLNRQNDSLTERLNELEATVKQLVAQNK